MKTWSGLPSKIKRACKKYWTEREYHVYEDADVAQEYVKMFFNTNHLVFH